MAIEEVFMSSKRYTDEFRSEAVKQVTERGHTVAEVAVRIGISKHTLYDWVQRARSRRTAAPQAKAATWRGS
jgi:transposase